jgi:hypothetical protein
MPDAHWPSGAYAAEFADAAALSNAVRQLRSRGYLRVETYTPYALDTSDPAAPPPRSRLPVVVFIAGVLGALAGYGIQWYANVASYPLNIGGRPAHATPAFLIPTFESTILCASLAAFVGLFSVLGLPRLWHPMFEADEFDRASIDRYWLAIDATDDEADPEATPRLLASLRAERVVRVPALA